MKRKLSLGLCLLSATLTFGQKFSEMISNGGYSVKEIQKEAESYFDAHGRGKGSGYKQFKIWEYQATRNSDENGFVIKSQKTAKEVRKYRGNLQNRSQESATWTEMGPDTKNPTSSWNPGVGRVECISVDPNNYNHILIGTPSGGAWSTTVGGGTWTPLTDQLETMDMRSVAIDPNNSSTYYIGTTSGLYKSTNSGSSWTRVYANYTWNKIKVNPNNSNIILGATSSGLVRSTDGGSNWSTAQTGAFTDIEFKPNSPSTVYACSNGTVYYSNDEGASFSTSTGTTGSNSRIAVTDADPNYVYFINSSEALYRSTNSGVSFSQRNAGSNDVFGGLAWYGMGFAVSNSNKDVVYAGGFELYKSTNGGTSFTKHVPWTWNNSSGLYIHADMHAMENVGPYIFTGTDGGISRGDANGTQFDDLSAGMGIRQFYRIGISKSDPGTVVAGAQDNGTAVINSGASLWNEFMGADGMEPFIDQNNASNLFGTIQNGGVYKSTNGGLSATSIGKPGGVDGAWVTPMEQDPQDPSNFYVVNTSIYKRTITGNSWTLVSAVPSGSKASELKFAPSNSNYVYLAQGNSIWRSTNKAQTWTSISSGVSGEIQYIAVHPNNHLKVAIATKGSAKVYVSEDGGNSWSAKNTGLPNITAYCVQWDDNSDNGLYVGMHAGIYYIDDQLSSYVAFMDNIPLVRVYELEVDYTDDKIYAGTYGRGLWVSDTYGNGVALQKNVSLVSVNGFESATTCGLSITSPNVVIKNKGEEVLTSVKIEVYMNNSLIQTINESSISLNKNESATINLDAVTAISGGNDYKVVLSLPNGGVDENPSDNELEVSNNFAEGVLHTFYIDTDSKDPNLNWSISDNGSAVISMVDVTPNVNGFKEEYSFCLVEGCYDIEVTNALQSGTCTVDPWSASTTYTGGEIVSYGGRKYEAKWWTKGDQPDNTQPWQDLGECVSGSPTDIFGFKNTESGTAYFEIEAQNFNNPYQNSFCNGSSYSFDFSAPSASVANCTDVVYTATESGGNGTNFSWDFGAGASPASATGIGPHTVSYTSTGKKTVGLTVDGTLEEKVDYLDVLQNTSIDANVDMVLSDGGNPSCSVKESHEFTATGTNEGVNPTYDWYVGTTVEQSGSNTVFNWPVFDNGDEIRVVMHSSDPCVAQQEVTSSSITLVLDICTSVDAELDAQTKIYPNPVSNNLTLKYSGNDKLKWEILDINGKVISSGNLGINEQRVVDLSTYANGSYLVRYTSGHSSNITHLIKK